ncbi:MAG: redoxin domain-containing protein [Bacteroidales bacterium]|nr:redoxin domain-containing protein [Bacteroidales bacterium]
MELPTSANLNNKEQVIIDSKKYNLIVFSASWCGPCREEIPILKHIYNDLNAKLDIVYISIDEAKTVEAWQKLIQMEAIPGAA